MQNSELCQNGSRSCSYDQNIIQSQNPIQSQRLSPDITRITFYSQSEELGVKSELVDKKGCPHGGGGGEAIVKEEEEGSNNKDHELKYHSMHLHPIAEIPLGFYQYFQAENGELRILCKVCNYVSNKKSNFKRHFTNMHFIHEEDKFLECCGIRFSTKGEKCHHTKSVHKFGYKCPICMKVFDRPALLQRHLAKHTGKKPYKCSLCTYQTPNKANAKRHIEKRHPDAPEGSILFVTDDGEQIQMDVFPKTEKDSSQESSPGSASGSSVKVKSEAGTATATAFPFIEELIGMPMPIPVPRFRFPPSATVTSSTFIPPGLRSGPDLEEKRRQIGHSIDSIMSRGDAIGMNNFMGNNPAAAAFQEGNQNQNNKNPENGSAPAATALQSPSSLSSSSFIPLIGYNQHHHHQQQHHQPMNELLRRTHSSLDWSQSSSSPYFNGATATATVTSLPFPSSSAPAPTLLNHHRPFPPVLFRQCPHGCWHQLDHFPDNQVTSDFLFDSQQHQFKNSNSSPDLRSSSSFSQENSESNTSTTQDTSPEREQDDDDDDSDELIDVVGLNSDEDDGEGEDRKRNLNFICEGLGNCSTVEISNYNQNHHTQVKREEGECENSSGPRPPPPVVSCVIRNNGNEGVNIPVPEQSIDGVGAEEYIPKKLRMSKSFMNKVQMF